MSSASLDRTVIQQLQAFFNRNHVDTVNHTDIVCVYMYGSVARGEARGTSDIDVAVLYAQEPPPLLDSLGLELGSTLERLLGKPVDLVILNRAPLDLIHRVLRDGVLVYESDPSSRIRFEVQARSAYFDLLPYLRQYRHATPGGRRD
jgi:predicted nucleotidyltransferase